MTKYAHLFPIKTRKQSTYNDMMAIFELVEVPMYDIIRIIEPFSSEVEINHLDSLLIARGTDCNSSLL